MDHPTKTRLLEAGLSLMLERGYSALSIQDLLDRTGVPKGSFYHHFGGKEDFALQVIDAYVANVHAALDELLGDQSRAPLDRVRSFFELSAEKYRTEGYLGCLLGGLGQELSGVNDVFRRRIEGCLASIAERLARCIAEARARGDVSSAISPRAQANLLVNCWEGAALRSRLLRDPAPLEQVLDFYFQAIPTS